MSATLKDVATHAGVSIKTASNVANARECVADDTRERVLASIAALNYRPNLGARHLRQRQVGVLALAIPEVSASYFAEIAHAIIDAAAAHAYTVLVDHTGRDRANEVLVVRGLRPHLIDGVILSPLVLETDDLRPGQIGLPLVLLGERLPDAPWDHVVIDNVAASRLATAHLLGLGRRRIAVIGAQDEIADGTSQLRLQGYREALAEAGRPVDPRLIAAAPSYHRADGAAAMRDLLATGTPPDAVFCFNDLLAMGALRVLHEAGLRIPEDVAVVGFDDIEEASYATPTLTTIAPDKREIARVAVELLVERIKGRRAGPAERIEPPFRLVVRESTAGTGPGWAARQPRPSVVAAPAL